jgi:hypothetical protein
MQLHPLNSTHALDDSVMSRPACECSAKSTANVALCDGPRCSHKAAARRGYTHAGGVRGQHIISPGILCQAYDKLGIQLLGRMATS